MKTAGESDDRRFASRKKRRREESPDSHSPQLARVSDYRATRLVTPGGCREVPFEAATGSFTRSCDGYGKCHRKSNRRWCYRLGGRPAGNHGPACFGAAHLARV